MFCIVVQDACKRNHTGTVSDMQREYGMYGFSCSVSFALPRSISFQPRINIALVYGWHLFGFPSLLISNLSITTLPSDPISKLAYSLLQAYPVPNNSIRSLLIRHFHVDFSVAVILHPEPDFPISQLSTCLGPRDKGGLQNWPGIKNHILQITCAL